MAASRASRLHRASQGGKRAEAKPSRKSNKPRAGEQVVVLESGENFTARLREGRLPARAHEPSGS